MFKAKAYSAVSKTSPLCSAVIPRREWMEHVGDEQYQTPTT